MKGAFKKQMFVQAKNLDLKCGQESSSKNFNPQSFIDPATYMCNGEFVFRIPPEAPVFEPTVEEFLDPLAYINKIRPVAEKTGICKVRPPPEWHPPFAVDVDHFKFTPRIQKLNELDANTRVKLYFLDRLATYWSYNGVQIRIPAIDDKTVDMYSLYKVVELEGGFDKVNMEKKWTKVASRMGYVNEKIVAPQLRQYYKRLLLPYEKFEKMKSLQESDSTTNDKDVKKETDSASASAVAVDLDDNIHIKIESNCANTEVSATGISRCNGSSSSNSVGTRIRNNCSDSSSTVKPCNGIRRCTRSTCDENDTEILVSDTFKNPVIQDKNKELQRLTFYGPGPKILGSNKSKFSHHQSQQQQQQQQQEQQQQKQQHLQQPHNVVKQEMLSTPAATGFVSISAPMANAAGAAGDLLADSACMVCGKGDSEECILLCDGCDDGYHTFCLTPPLNSIPKGEWRCPKCIAVVVSKASDTTFGFEQAEREYSLQQFGEMADQFKSNYFNMPVHMVPTEKVEQEYWKILSSMDSNVTVEYGADLHSMDHGSGFPTQMALKQSGDENHYYKSYVESSWNLNNIPVLEGSVLGYINADISGMKIPWMYVGMCFSTFCWHNEDHWSYSINYLHWGEPKTWYGVPGFMAEHFERVMQETTPDLFRNQPDLLHQLVTILNPNILMDRGVPVYHIDQAAGEFVLTFPRAYHAGFNHGYNFAEAVNFAPVDWIPLGRECVQHYSTLHRYCVFSHDELICKMASVPENLNSKLASATHQDMLKMLDVENKQRKVLLEWGVVNAEREAFELLADDERKCAECNTTCFLSAVTCKCSPKKVTCLRHFKEHCGCLPIEHTLRYRYTLDELPVMLEKLKEKADSVAAWAAKVHDALDVNTPRTITLSGLKELLNEAREKHFPDDLSLSLLSKAIKSVQDALAVDFKNILSHKQTLSKKVTLMEIRSYYEELQRIPCVLPQENTVKHFLKFLEEFQENAERMLNNECATVHDVENLLKQSHFPNVEIPYVETLKNYKKMLYLIEEYDQKCKTASISLTPSTVDQLLNCSKSVNSPNARVTSINKELTTLKEQIVSWESKVKHCLGHDFSSLSHSSSSSSFIKFAAATPNTNTKSTLNKLEELLQEADGIKAFLPSKEKLSNQIQKVVSWKNRANNVFLQKKSPPIFFELVERLIEEGENMPIEFEEMPKLRAAASKVLQWKEEVHRLFLGDCEMFSLLEVLMPRRNSQRICRYRNAATIVTAASTNTTTPTITTTTTTTATAATTNHGNKNSGDEKTAIMSMSEHVDLSAMADIINAAVGAAGKDELDLENIVSSFKVVEKREFELMRALRVKNIYKKKQGNGSFCICENSPGVSVSANAATAVFSSMKECTLCKDLFHEQCLKKLANYWEDRRQNSSSRIFLCPFCQRSKRPSSKLVANALCKLQKLQMRTLEGVAMQCLIEREAKWKESVDQLLKTPELSMLSRITAESKLKSGGKFNTPVTLSNENKNSLESLLFRGFLLELELPENEIIYKILHKLDSNSMDSSVAGCQSSMAAVVPASPVSATATTGTIGLSMATNIEKNNYYYGASSKCPSQVDVELSNETCSLKNELAATFVSQPNKENNKKRKYLAFGMENNENDEVRAMCRQYDTIINDPSSRLFEKNKNNEMDVAAIRKRTRKSNICVGFTSTINADIVDIATNSAININTTVTTTTTTTATATATAVTANCMRMRHSLGKSEMKRENVGVVLEKSRQQLLSPEKSKNLSFVSGYAPLAQINSNNNGKVKLKESGEQTEEETISLVGGGEEEEDEIECDAKQCVKPSGEHVDWVQCDYCKNWLHMICIGVTKREVDNQTEFMCSLCKNADSFKTKEDNLDDDDDDVVFVEYASNNAALCSS